MATLLDAVKHFHGDSTLTEYAEHPAALVQGGLALPMVFRAAEGAAWLAATDLVFQRSRSVGDGPVETVTVHEYELAGLAHVLEVIECIPRDAAVPRPPPLFRLTAPQGHGIVDVSALAQQRTNRQAGAKASASRDWVRLLKGTHDLAADMVAAASADVAAPTHRDPFAGAAINPLPTTAGPSTDIDIDPFLLTLFAADGTLTAQFPPPPDDSVPIGTGFFPAQPAARPTGSRPSMHRFDGTAASWSQKPYWMQLCLRDYALRSGEYRADHEGGWRRWRVGPLAGMERGVIVNSMDEVCAFLRVSRLTYHSSVGLLDRFLALAAPAAHPDLVEANHFRCLIIASVYVASKLHDVTPPPIARVIEALGVAVRPDVLCSVEMRLLTTVAFATHPLTLLEVTHLAAHLPLQAPAGADLARLQHHHAVTTALISDVILRSRCALMFGALPLGICASFVAAEVCGCEVAVGCEEFLLRTLAPLAGTCFAGAEDGCDVTAAAQHLRACRDHVVAATMRGLREPVATIASRYSDAFLASVAAAIAARAPEGQFE